MRRVWIATVVLDDRRGLQRTAASVLQQDYPNLRWIIADGGSHDGSWEFAQQITGVKSHVTAFPGPDSGIYDGMNRLLRQVPDEDYIWFLNAGDFFLSESSVTSAVDLVDDGGWVGGPMALFRGSGLLHKVTDVPTLSQYRYGPGADVPSQPTVLAARSLHRMVGEFRVDLSLAADGVFLQQLARLRAPRLVTTPLVGFVLGGRSTRHHRRSMSQFWSAGYRPPGLRDRIAIRDVGSVRALARLRVSPPSWAATLLGRRGIGVEPSFDHWADHHRAGNDYSCCLQMQWEGNLTGARRDSA